MAIVRQMEGELLETKQLYEQEVAAKKHKEEDLFQVKQRIF